MKSLIIDRKTLIAIQENGQEAYPEEGAGLIFGVEDNGERKAISIYPIKNAREESSRHNRYLITAKDMLNGEIEAEKIGLDVIGIFHSHPDHPAEPSKFDKDWAMPWFSYIITSIDNGNSGISKSWRLEDDRSQFLEENIYIIKSLEN